MLWLVTDRQLLEDSRQLLNNSRNFAHSLLILSTVSLVHIMFTLREVSFSYVDSGPCYQDTRCSGEYIVAETRHQCCVEWGGGSTSEFGQSVCTPC